MSTASHVGRRWSPMYGREPPAAKGRQAAPGEPRGKVPKSVKSSRPAGPASQLPPGTGPAATTAKPQGLSLRDLGQDGHHRGSSGAHHQDKPVTFLHQEGTDPGLDGNRPAGSYFCGGIAMQTAVGPYRQQE